MFTPSHLSKLSLAIGTAAVAATLALSVPASARPFGPHPGFRAGPHFVGGPRISRQPRFIHGRRVFVGRPVHYRNYGCVIRHRKVWSPAWGWHWAKVRVCY